MEPRLIRISAFVLAAVILLGSLSIWAVNTQDTTTADIGDVYDIDLERNEDLENILSNTTMSSDSDIEFGGINEDKTLFTIILDEDYPETYINGTISLYNNHEVSRYLDDLDLQLEANGEEVGWLGLSTGYARFEVGRELDETEIHINTTGEGSHAMKEDGEFELGFLAEINEKQRIVRSQENISVVAEEYELSVDMNVEGTLLVDGDEVDVPYEDVYEEGTVVDIETIPDEEVEFIEWDGDTEDIDDPQSNDTTITMNADYEIIAVFETEVELTIDSEDGGEVTEPGEGTFTYITGEVVDLEAVADEGYHFVEWTGDINEIEDTTASQTTIEMLDDYSITAEFEINTYVLTIDSEDGGEVVEPGEGDFEYDHGTVVDLVAESDPAWAFDEWVGDNGTIEDTESAETTITMENDYTITATFEEIGDTPFFEVDILGTDDPAIADASDIDEERGTLVVDVLVENTGDAEGTQTIELLDFGGNSVDDETLTLGADDSLQIELTWQPEVGDSGEDEITVTSDDDDDTEEVLITRLEGDDEEITYSTDDQGEGTYEYLEETVDVSGMDEIFLVFEYELNGDTHPAQDDSLAAVSIEVDGEEVYYDESYDEEDRTTWTPDEAIDVSDEDMVEVRFEAYLEEGQRDSEVTIYQAYYETMPEENGATANSVFEPNDLKEDEMVMDVEDSTSVLDINHEENVPDKLEMFKIKEE